MDYNLEGHNYSISYLDLRERYILFCQMTDNDFVKDLPAAIHLACVICFFKEIPSYVCLSDRGIVHELAHLLHIPDDNTRSLRDIRKLFEDQLKLS